MAAEDFNMNTADRADQGSAEIGQSPPAPGASGVRGGAATMATGSGKPRIRPIHFVLVGLFAVGIGSVYLLSLRKGPQSASAEERTTEAKVDAALHQLDVASTLKPDETNAVIDTFYYEAKQRQIPLSHLKGNPFIYVPPGGGKTLLKPNRKVANLAEIQRREALEDRMQAVRGLRLQSVLMASDGARAMISNNMVVEGKTIHGWTVKSIQPRKVILTWKNHEHVLKLPR